MKSHRPAHESGVQRFLHQDLITLIEKDPERIRGLEQFLEKNKTHFDTKVAELGLAGQTKSAIDNALRGKIVNIERNLEQHFKGRSMYTISGVRSMLEEIFSASRTECPEGIFLSDDAAQRILEAHPPVRLLSLLTTNSINGGSVTFSPREILGLTRQSESTEWQETYYKILTEEPAESFVPGTPLIVVIDPTTSEEPFTHPEQQLKPWNMTHIKESGVIVCFTMREEQQLKVPLLQYSSVFLHYLYETTCSGAYLAENKRSGALLGARITNVIKGDAHRFPFFSANTYSETIFWERALVQFGKLFPSDAFAFFADTTSCGGHAMHEGDVEGTLVSLNIVDHIWNVSLSGTHETEQYFGSTIPDFLYHFQEVFWYTLFAYLQGWDDQRMEKEVLTQLHVGDIPFTETAFKQSA